MGTDVSQVKGVGPPIIFVECNAWSQIFFDLMTIPAKLGLLPALGSQGTW